MTVDHKILLRERWIFKSKLLSRLQSVYYQYLVPAPARYFDRGFFELRSMPNVSDSPAPLAEKCGRRNHNPIGNAIYRHANDCTHSRGKAHVAVCQSYLNREIPGNRPSGVEIQARGGTDCVDVSAEAAIGNSVHAYRGGLAQFQLTSLRLFDAG